MADVATLVDQAGKLSDDDKTKFISDFIAGQNVLWLSGAVKALEDKFGVKAAAPVMMGGAMPAGGGAAPAEAEAAQDSFDVVIKEAGANKLQVIKVVRQYRADLGLKDAKDLVEKGGTVKEALPKEEAEKVRKELEAAGAKIELK